MCEPLPATFEAVIVCTRNRSGELSETLKSIAAQSDGKNRPVIVVDGSDRNEAEQTARVVREWQDQGIPFFYRQYSGAPAGTRQRNAGVDLLPESVEIIHFLDDDVALQPGYFETIRGALRQHPSLLGVGGVIVEPGEEGSPPPVHWAERFFLLRSDQPSCVLPSGQTTSAWPSVDGTVQPADWLSTCASSYRAEVFDRHRFDPAVEGPSPRLEDLDFSVRVAQDGPLAVVPGARCVHRVSPQNRRDTADTTRERLVRRYWFVEKNMNRLVNRLAFWWSALGQLIALVASSNPDSRAALRGHLRGLQQVWTRAHPLLSEEPDDP